MQPVQYIQREVRGLIHRVKLSLELSPSIAKGHEKDWQVDRSIKVSEELGSRNPFGIKQLHRT